MKRTYKCCPLQLYNSIVIRYPPLKFLGSLNNLAVEIKVSLPDLRLINLILGHFLDTFNLFSLTKAKMFGIYHFSSLSRISASN